MPVQLNVLREADLLGEISPGLRDGVYQAVRSQAKTAADQAWAALLTAYNNAKRRIRESSIQIGTKPLNKNPLEDPAVKETLRLAYVAEEAAERVGVPPLNRVANFPASAGG